MPPQQTPRPPPPMQPRNTPVAPPVGPRRGPAITGPGTPSASTPPTAPAIPTGPRAGNFPYRSSLPSQAPARYVPVITGPGAIIPGGRLLPPHDKASEDRLARLRAEEVKLREELEISREKKRKGMYAWDKSRREAEIASFRVEVAERQLMAGEVSLD